MGDIPGLHSKPFTIKLQEDWYKKGDILKVGSSLQQFIIIKAYRDNLLKKLMRWLHIYTKYSMRIAKVKVVYYETK